MNETLLNKARLNVVSLNKALINGAVERHGSSAGGGGVIIPPSEPDVPDVPVTYILSASASNGVVSASVNGKAVALPYTANDGDVVVVEVTANDGYQFEGWSDGSTDNPRSIIMTTDVTLSATCVVKAVEKEYIQFADPAVEAVLMSKGVSSDGIGITLEDAAKVTSIGTWFNGNTEITSFDEFRFFGVNSLSIQSFYGCTSLKSIVIPASVTEIPPYGVFQNCTSLQRVTFNGDIAGIYNEAFLGCSALSDINIPESVAGFGNSAFAGCTNMRIHLYLPNLITDSQWDTSRVFANTGILSANLPNVQKIGGDFFAGSKELVKVDIGASAVSIGSSLCNGCTSLTTLICRAVTPPSIGNNIIANAPNAYIYVPDASVEAYKTATNWVSYADRIHPLSELEGSPYIQFADAEVERVLMENNVSSDGVGITMADAQAVTSIGSWFNGNQSIETFDELQYFTGLTYLTTTSSANGNNAAFFGCTSLRRVTLPLSITTIGDYSFCKCSSLSEIKGVDNVVKINRYAFQYTALTELEFPNVSESNGGPFSSSTATKLLLPNFVKTSGSLCDQMTNLQLLLLGANTNRIGSYSFWRMTSNQTTLICLATTSPALEGSNNLGFMSAIYVPDASVDAYKSATNWTSASAKFKGVSQLATDNPTLYEEIQKYL